MAFFRDVRVITAPTSITPSFPVTGLGFAPKGLMAFCTAQTADGSATHAEFSLGFGAGSSDRRSMCYRVNDSFGSEMSARRQVDNLFLASCDNLGSLVMGVDLVSLDGDGYTFNFSTVDGIARKIVVVAWGGDEVSAAKTVQWQVPTSTGNQDVTVSGQTPRFVIHATLGSAVAPPSGAAAYVFGIGVFNDAGEQSALCVSGNEISPTTAGRYQRTNKAAAHCNQTAVTREATFVSVASGKFTLNWEMVNASAVWEFGLSLAGTFRSKIMPVAQKTSTGTQAYTGMNFMPVLGLHMGTVKVAGTGFVANARLSFGAASGPSSRAAAWGGFSDGSSPTSFADQAFEGDRAIEHWVEGTPTQVGSADLTSFDPDGETLNWLVADGSAYESLGVFFAAAPILRTFEANLTASVDMTVLIRTVGFDDFPFFTRPSAGKLWEAPSRGRGWTLG